MAFQSIIMAAKEINPSCAYAQLTVWETLPINLAKLASFKNHADTQAIATIDDCDAQLPIANVDPLSNHKMYIKR